MKKYVCSICSFVYDEAASALVADIAPGTKWDDLPDDWLCPQCGTVKEDFRDQEAVMGNPKKQRISQDILQQDANQLPL